jgi:hypothetical protein
VLCLAALDPDGITLRRALLFATKGGDNSVSSFGVDKDGRLTMVDCKPAGNPVKGKSGTAKSLAYSTAKGMLYVVHSFGPDRIRLTTVDGEGKLTGRMERLPYRQELDPGGDR